MSNPVADLPVLGADPDEEEIIAEDDDPGLPQSMADQEQAAPDAVAHNEGAPGAPSTSEDHTEVVEETAGREAEEEAEEKAEEAEEKAEEKVEEVEEKAKDKAEEKAEEKAKDKAEEKGEEKDGERAIAEEEPMPQGAKKAPSPAPAPLEAQEAQEAPESPRTPVFSPASPTFSTPEREAKSAETLAVELKTSEDWARMIALSPFEAEDCEDKPLTQCSGYFQLWCATHCCEVNWLNESFFQYRGWKESLPVEDQIEPVARINAMVRSIDDTRPMAVLVCLFDKYMHTMAMQGPELAESDWLDFTNAPFAGILPESWLNSPSDEVRILAARTLSLKAELDQDLVNTFNVFYLRALEAVGRGSEYKWIPHKEAMHRIRYQSMKRPDNPLSVFEGQLPTLPQGAYIPEHTLIDSELYIYEELTEARATSVAGDIRTRLEGRVRPQIGSLYPVYHRGRPQGRGDQRSRKRQRDRGRDRSHDRSRDRSRNRSRDRSRDRDRSQRRDRDRERDRDRSRGRHRGSDRSHYRRRSPSRSPPRSRTAFSSSGRHSARPHHRHAPYQRPQRHAAAHAVPPIVRMEVRSDVKGQEWQVPIASGPAYYWYHPGRNRLYRDLSAFPGLGRRCIGVPIGRTAGTYLPGYVTTKDNICVRGVFQRKACPDSSCMKFHEVKVGAVMTSHPAMNPGDKPRALGWLVEEDRHHPTLRSLMKDDALMIEARKHHVTYTHAMQIQQGADLCREELDVEMKALEAEGLRKQQPGHPPVPGLSYQQTTTVQGFVPRQGQQGLVAQQAQVTRPLQQLGGHYGELAQQPRQSSEQQQLQPLQQGMQYGELPQQQVQALPHQALRSLPQAPLQAVVYQQQPQHRPSAPPPQQAPPVGLPALPASPASSRTSTASAESLSTAELENIIARRRSTMADFPGH